MQVLLWFIIQSEDIIYLDDYTFVVSGNAEILKLLNLISCMGMANATPKLVCKRYEIEYS